MIDLHTHSNQSDGKLAPAELIYSAAKKGISVIALTDHDTIAGLDDAKKAAKQAGVTFVPGIEIGIEYKGGELHLLGLNLEHHPEDLTRSLDELKRHRQERNLIILDKIRCSGLSVTFDELQTAAGSATIGRLHFARLFINKGYASSIKDAFNRYFDVGKPFYEKKRMYSLEEGCQILKNTGARIVVAHPITLKLPFDDLKSWLLKSKKAGIVGIEAYHPDQSLDYCKALEDFGREHGFIITGGSDFHGDGRNRSLGMINLDFPIPDNLVSGII